jgi:hypothetical protein
VENNANLRIVFCGLRDWNVLDELGDGAFGGCDLGDFGAPGEDAERGR